MIPFSIVVAMDQKRGIGKAGGLPWHLPADLKHFKKITTTRFLDKTYQNVVIMGRKTWDSLPINFRPLPDRINIVLTRNDKLDFPSGVYKAKNFNEAFYLLNKEDM